MCTVTYVPCGGDEFIFTSNRDEAPRRSPQGLQHWAAFGQNLLFPRDTAAGGTWIAVSDADRLLCVLNGAFSKHQHRPPYRRSRGLMALDAFAFADVRDFARHYELRGMEPFTLVLWQLGQLWECRWDGAQRYWLPLDPQARHIWSSCTLYPPEWQRKREQWLADWAAAQPLENPDAMLAFHRHAGEGHPEYDVVMNRQDIVRTVSITQVRRSAEGLAMRYEELLSGEIHEDRLRFA